LAGAVVLVAVAVGVFVVISRPGGRQTAARTNVQVSQAHQVAQALSGLARDPAALVATEAMPQVAGQASKAVPVGAKVSADEQSWAPDGAGGGTMLVTVTAPGQPPVSYLTVVVQEAGGWKVSGTIPIQAATPSTTSHR
jgi:hypothetical protein